MGAHSCLEREASPVELMANLTKVATLVKNPPGDPILLLRAALKRLALTLVRLGAASSLCSGPSEPSTTDSAKTSTAALQAAAAQLQQFVEDGKINDGMCPF